MRKAAKAEADDDLRPEYDFSTLKGAVRGKYFQRYRAGVNIVLLEPEIAAAFPTDAAVNEALRGVLRATRGARRASRLPNKRKHRTMPAQGSKPRR